MKEQYVDDNWIKLLYLLGAVMPICFIGLFVQYHEYNVIGYVFGVVYSIGCGWFYGKYIYQRKWLMMANIIQLFSSTGFAYGLLKDSNWYFPFHFILVLVLVWTGSILVQLITIYLYENVDVDLKKLKI